MNTRHILRLIKRDMTNNSGVTMAPMNKKHSRLGFSVLVNISHRKYGSYKEAREKVLEAL